MHTGWTSSHSTTDRLRRTGWCAHGRRTCPRTPPEAVHQRSGSLAEQPGTDPAAEAVRHIARALAEALDERGLSLRAAADGSGVNRQAIADLLAGRCWPDVATVARPAAFTGAALWPPTTTADRKGKH
jgi:hypothetical protein